MKNDSPDIPAENPGFEPFEVENDWRIAWAICAGFAAVIAVIIFTFG
jgi:hypothetical protein